MKTEPGKYYKNAQALKQILKPKVSAHKKEQVLKKFYDEALATDSELYNKLADKDPGRYTGIMRSRYDGTPTPKDYPRKEFAYVDRFGNRESATDRIQEQDKKKKVVKKDLPKDWKPKYLNGNVIDMMPMIDDDWFKIFEDESVDPKEETRRRNFEKILRENAKAKIARGLEGLMRLNPTAKRRIT